MSVSKLVLPRNGVASVGGVEPLMKCSEGFQL